MSAATATQTGTGIDFRALAETVAPGRIRFDPLGFVSGYKAYQIYTGLSAKSDADLAGMGLTRADLPHVAMSAASVLRDN